MVVFPADDRGETLASALAQVEPQVVGECALAVGALGGLEEAIHDFEALGIDVPANLEAQHSVRVPPLRRVLGSVAAHG